MKVLCLVSFLALTLFGSVSHFQVLVKKKQGEFQGSGFYVNDTGLALISAHQIRDMRPRGIRVRTWWTGRESGLRARVMVKDILHDIAVIQVDEKHTTPVPKLCAGIEIYGDVVVYGNPEFATIKNRGKVVKIDLSDIETPIELSAFARGGYSGGSATYYPDSGGKCTAGVISRYHDVIHHTYLVHPARSLTVMDYLCKHAPRFVEDFALTCNL